MKRTLWILPAIIAILLSFSTLHQAEGHCQVPCGIYDDAARVAAMQEHAVSIAKAMPEINALLTQGTPVAFNQSTRWVIEKDRSVTAIQKIVADYFLTQRVKFAGESSPDRKKYLEQLEAFHGILVAAMRCRSTTDPVVAQSLEASIARIAPWYKNE